MNRVAMQIGGLNIYWYSIMILIGAVLAFLIVRKESSKLGIEKKDVEDFAFGLVPSAIVGARLYYCIFSFSEFKDNPIDILKIWEGGLAIHGGIIAGLIWLIYFTNKRKINKFIMMDMVSIGLILGQAIGRWGNFFNAEAHGGMTTKSFLQSLHIPNFIIEGMNIKGVYYQPTFLYESIWCLIGFVILYSIFKKVKITGVTISSYCIWYSIGRFLIEGMRTDSLMIGSLRMAQVISIVIFIIGIIGLILSLKRKDVIKNV